MPTKKGNTERLIKRYQVVAVFKNGKDSFQRLVSSKALAIKLAKKFKSDPKYKGVGVTLIVSRGTAKKSRIIDFVKVPIK